MNKITVVSLAASAILFAGSDPFAGLSGTLRIAGGTAHIPTMKAVAAEVTQAHPDVKIAIAGGGSGVGIKKAGEGLVDIGNAGRKASDAEIKKYGLVLHKWAIDGIAVVTSPENNITALSRQQIADVFAGKVTDWKALGGHPGAIHLYTRDAASGTRKVFWKKVLHKGTMAPNATVVASNGAMKRAISGDKGAMGFLSAGFIDTSVTGVAIDGVAPTHANIQNGSYTYARGLYSITKGEAKGLAKAMIDTMLSTHVQHDIVAAKGFVPVR